MVLLVPRRVLSGMLCASTKTATEHRPKAASYAIIGEKVLTSTDSMQVTTSTRKLTAKARSAPTPPQQKNSNKPAVRHRPRHTTNGRVRGAGSCLITSSEKPSSAMSCLLASKNICSNCSSLFSISILSKVIGKFLFPTEQMRLYCSLCQPRDVGNTVYGLTFHEL